MPHVVLTEAYDSGNDRTSLAATVNGTPDFLNSYTYDADHRLTDETQQGQSGGNGVAPKQITFGYNPLGQFTSIARYDYVGVGPMVDIATAALSYDNADRLTNLGYTANSGGIHLDSFSFSFDSANRVTDRTSTVDGAADYGYDNVNEVTSASYSGGSGEPANEAYSYTLNGNRTNTGYSTGANNQLLSDGTFNYSYDGEGNRTVRTRISDAYASDYRTTYSWDYRNRLTDVSDYDNNGVLTKHVHYIYDTLDHEIGKQVDDTGGGSYDRSEWYVLDVLPATPVAAQPSGWSADPLLQFDQNGNLQFRYFSGPSPAGGDTVYAEEQIGTQGQAGTEYWPLGDNENTPHEVVNVNSEAVDHIIANSFGVVTSETNPSIHHWCGFQGGHFDPDTAMIDDYFRWYDPATARWLSVDPSGFAAGDLNLTRYVGNRVANSIDATGLQTVGPGVSYTTAGTAMPGGVGYFGTFTASNGYTFTQALTFFPASTAAGQSGAAPKTVMPNYPSGFIGPKWAYPAPQQTAPTPPPPISSGPKPWQTKPGVGGNWTYVPTAKPGWYSYPQPAHWAFTPTGPQVGEPTWNGTPWSGLTPEEKEALEGWMHATYDEMVRKHEIEEREEEVRKLEEQREVIEIEVEAVP